MKDITDTVNDVGNVFHDSFTTLTVATYQMGYNYVHAYGTKSRKTVPACPIQIIAHHHTDVYTDINNLEEYFLVRSWATGDFFYFIQSTKLSRLIGFVDLIPHDSRDVGDEISFKVHLFGVTTF